MTGGGEYSPPGGYTIVVGVRPVNKQDNQKKTEEKEEGQKEGKTEEKEEGQKEEEKENQEK